MSFEKQVSNIWLINDATAGTDAEPKLMAVITHVCIETMVYLTVVMRTKNYNIGSTQDAWLKCRNQNYVMSFHKGSLVLPDKRLTFDVECVAYLAPVTNQALHNLTDWPTLYTRTKPLFCVGRNSIISLQR